MSSTIIVWGGRKRKCFKKVCKQCLGEFYLPAHRYLKSSYCSKKCASRSQESKVIVSCAQCGEFIYKTSSSLRNSKHRLYFCDRSCKDTGQSLLGKAAAIRPKHYGSGPGLSDYRNYAFSNKSHRCEACGYDKVAAILHVHHKDKDRSNNALDNLVILCPNCHMEDHYLAKDGIFQMAS